MLAVFGKYARVHHRIVRSRSSKERDTYMNPKEFCSTSIDHHPISFALTTNAQPIPTSPHFPVLECFDLQNPAVTTICLNRPTYLHALSTAMCSTLYFRFSNARDHHLKLILLTSTTPTRAFCAGGDIRTMCLHAESHRHFLVDQFFRLEYSLFSLLGSFNEPQLVALLDGVVMGGGVGLSIHAPFRVATEHSIFAMPEVNIGLHPDAGASYFLPRLSSGLGLYLALTGARLNSDQLVSANIATHFVPSAAIPDLLTSLQQTNHQFKHDIETILGTFSRPHAPPTQRMQSLLDAVQELFTLPSVSEIIENLKRVAACQSHRFSHFAKDALQMMLAACPMSMAVAYEALKRGAAKSLDDCLKMEFRLTARLIRRSDFTSGVRALLIEKHRNPVWSPSSVSGITSGEVEKMFEPLENDVQVPELVFSHRKHGETSRNQLRSARL